MKNILSILFKTCNIPSYPKWFFNWLDIKKGFNPAKLLNWFSCKRFFINNLDYSVDTTTENVNYVQRGWLSGKKGVKPGIILVSGFAFFVFGFGVQSVYANTISLIPLKFNRLTIRLPHQSNISLLFFRKISVLTTILVPTRMLQIRMGLNGMPSPTHPV